MLNSIARPVAMPWAKGATVAPDWRDSWAAYEAHMNRLDAVYAGARVRLPAPGRSR